MDKRKLNLLKKLLVNYTKCLEELDIDVELGSIKAADYQERRKELYRIFRNDMKKLGL